jgi:prevent-host-death family protein
MTLYPALQVAYTGQTSQTAKGRTVTRWQLQEAKNRLSEVVRKATEEGPQVITLRGNDAVVVIAAKDYKQLSRRPRGTLVQFLRNSPLAGIALDLDRSPDTGRSVAL